MADEQSQQEGEASKDEESFNLADLRKEIHEIFKIVTAKNYTSNTTNNKNNRKEKGDCDDVFTIEEKRKLIQLVKPHKKMYNENFKKYKGNRELWKKISRELGGKCHLGTKLEWQRLKSRYFREDFKSDDPEYETRFELYEDLKFLKPFNKRRKEENTKKPKKKNKRNSSPQAGPSTRRSPSLVRNETKKEENGNESEENEDQEKEESNSGNKNNIPKNYTLQTRSRTQRTEKGKEKAKKVKKSNEEIEDISNSEETHNNEAAMQEIKILKHTISTLVGQFKNLSDNISDMKEDKKDISELLKLIKGNNK